MIDEYRAKRYCCQDISRIENYALAIADKNRIWHIHHKLECTNGIFTSRNELIANRLYYGRPADELIFLTPSDHNRLHSKDPNTQMKISNGVKHAWQNPKYKQRQRNARLGKRWYTDGVNNRYVAECPGEGWRLGKIHHKKRS